MNREIFSRLSNVYNIRFKAYKPVTANTYKVICENGNNYFIKKSNPLVQQKYQFLYDQGIKNILYPIKNNYGRFLTANNYNSYYVTNYIKDNTVVNEVKAVNLLDELANVHFNTYFKKQLSVDFSRRKMEELYEYLQYKFNMLESFVRTVETRPFDEYSIIILKNYRYILDGKKILSEIHKRLVSDIKSKKSVNFAFVHNNPKLNHLLNSAGNRYLISIDKAKIGISSLDLAKYYIECEDLKLDFKSIINNYFSKYEDDFYQDYFYFLVLLYYFKGFIVLDKDYVTSQNFLYVSEQIKKLINDFNLSDRL
mgnify:CR=1 FL=1